MHQNLDSNVIGRPFFWGGGAQLSHNLPTMEPMASPLAEREFSDDFLLVAEVNIFKLLIIVSITSDTKCM